MNTKLAHLPFNLNNNIANFAGKSNLSRKPITVLIACIDTIKKKNLYQLAGLEQRGYQFIVITSDSFGESKKITKSLSNTKVICASRYFKRLSILLSMLYVLLTRQVDIVEVYPGHRVNYLCAKIAKLFKLPLVLVARGAEYPYVVGTMPKKQRPIFRKTYLLADLVIYKEPYMKSMLDKLKILQRQFLPNAVAIPAISKSINNVGCNFLFLNGIRTVRHPDFAIQAFLEICNKFQLDSNSDIRLDIVGLRGKDSSANIAKERKLASMIAGLDVPIYLHPWTSNPDEWFKNTDVFVLPADVVFLNYSLLDAMARGIPAIIQNADSAEKIIQHGESGFILPLKTNEWTECMEFLINNPQLRIKLGQSSRKHITDNFSISTYLNTYDNTYKLLTEKPTRETLIPSES